MFVYTTLKPTTFQKGMDSAFVLALGLYISIELLLYNPPYKAWLDFIIKYIFSSYAYTYLFVNNIHSCAWA